MNKINWTIVAIVAVALLFVASLFGGRGYGWGMMGPGMMGGWGFSPFGWIGMAFMWLIPIGFLVLALLGIVWLVRAIGSGNQSAPRLTKPAHPVDAKFEVIGEIARTVAHN
jgi:uncharacterized membrane protein